MNLCQPGKAGERGLRGIAGNKCLGAGVLGGGDMNKIPSARRRTLGVTRAQFIAPVQEFREAVRPQP